MKTTKFPLLPHNKEIGAGIH